MDTAGHISLNLNVRGLGQSATLLINERCRELRAQGRAVCNMGLGQSPFPVPDPVVEALRVAAPSKDYLPVMGLPALREAVAAFHSKHDLLDARPENVIIGPGSKELMFLVQLVFYGEIMVKTPCWVSYLPQAQIIGRTVSKIDTRFESGWKITAEQLLRKLESSGDALRPRMLVLNYPANPSGQTYSAEELQELAEVARQFETIVLSDEIYGPLNYEGRHVSIARFYPEGTIVSSGLSKWCGAGGWRLGTFLFPDELSWLQEAVAAVASETYTSVSAPIQYAAVRAFQGGVEIERYLWHARRVLEALSRRCCDMLVDAGIRVHAPRGAFYLFLDFSRFREALARRRIHDGPTLAETVLEETGTAFLPGSVFVRPVSELTARLALVDFDGAQALAASENIPLHESLPEDFVEQYCPRVLEGVRRIAEWIARLDEPESPADGS
ncbi:MAG: aminotransferase class I/II-fold pyridoxal phosphate-dependent enzyme [Planctomycetota bacterium]|nr:MAG: aminotransferase class I/II-fold pyridoxal phosphate-dependent enzyme [Planctomycetota bacterium]